MMKLIKKHPWFTSALLITLLVTFWQQWPRLVDPYQIEEDFRTYYWMHRFRDPDLFVGDRLVFDRIIEYQLDDTLFLVDTASPGFTFLYQMASNFLSYITFSKLLIFPLTFLSVAYLYGIGKTISDRSTAFVLVMIFLVLNAAAPTSISTVGGLQRSFVFPFLLGILFHLVHRDDWLAALYLILGVLIYPSVFVLGVATYGIAVIHRQSDSIHIEVDWRRATPLVTSVVIGLIALVPYFLQRLAAPTEVTGSIPSFGEQVNTSGIWTGWQLLQSPLYQPGGRSQIVSEFPLAGRGGLATPGMGLMFILILGVLALGIWMLDRDVWRRQHKILHSFFGAIWLCFGLSWLVFLATGNFYFYLPSRYTEAGLILVLLIFVVVNGQSAMRQFVELLTTKRKVIAWILLLVAIGTLVLAIRLPTAHSSAGSVTPGDFRGLLFFLAGLLFMFAILYMRRRSVAVQSGASHSSSDHWMLRGGVILLLFILSVGFVALFQPLFYKATSAERQLFVFVQSLPQNTVLSGGPHILDSIPTFSKRQVFMNCENPYFNSQEVMDSLQAYYAPVGEEQRVEAFCQQYEVDYLVIDSRNYAPETRESSYCSFAPYDRALYDDIQSTSRFALDTIPEEQRLFQSGALSVVPCDTAIFSK